MKFLFTIIVILLMVVSVSAQTEECTCTKIESATTWNFNSEQADSIVLALCNCQMDSVQFKLYNRWGQKLVEVKSTTLKKEDFGENLPTTGTYLWTMSCFSAQNGLKQSLSGTITIMR
ncbi:MAG: hypothetical protein KDC92_07410 [Bacteroidetes bacterium]|nr:hypothetical protein [Bacteroidota bacterium]